MSICFLSCQRKRSYVYQKVLVLAVAGVLSSLAYAEPSVTLYGTADGGLVYQHVKNTGEKGTDTLALESGINDTTKWGLKDLKILGMEQRYPLSSRMDTTLMTEP